MAAGNLRVSLVINADGTAAIQTINRVRGSVGELDQAAGRAASGGLSAVTSQLKGLALTAGAALGLSNLAASFTAANVAAGTLRAGLETVTGSARAGAAAWAQLQEFAAQTPFSLQQATEGFIKLKAMGLDPSREALLSYANTASAMGKDLSMMIEAVVDASNSSFERLREFGITASQQGDKVSLTFQGMTTTIGNNAAEIESYLRRIGEVQFAGAIERQSETLGVALSNVGDAWDQLMVEIGDAGLTEALVDGLQEVTGWLAELKGEVADGLGGEINATVAETVALFGGWTEALTGITPALSGVVQALAELPNYNLVIRDGALALQEQGTAWEALVDLVGFAAQSFLDLPDNLRVAVDIILGEIDILKVNFQAGMDQLPLIAQQAWAAIHHAIVSAIGAIKIAVAEMVAYVAGQLASLARDMAGVMAQVPEALDIGGMASSAAASLGTLATSLESTESAVTGLKAEQAALGAQYAKDTAALQGQQKAITDRAESEIAAIRGVILAGIEETEAKKKARKAQAELNAEFARAEADQAKLERQSLKTGQAIAGAGKAAGSAVKPTNDLAKAKGGASKASKELASAQKAESQALQAALRTVEGLVRTYLPAKAAAQDYAEALAALATAGTAAGLSQEELATIMAGMARDQAKIADEARRAADGFYAAWADAVDSLDDTFQGLWRGLLTGQDDVLGNLKETVLEWVADLSYQLLISPLIVPIQGSLMGIMGGGAGGVTGTATSVLGGASSLSSMFSTGSTLFNAASSLFSGAAFSGISQGFALAMENISIGGYFGSFGTNMALAGSSASTGAMGTAIGAALPYAIPAAIAVAAAVAIFSKWQSDQEPRYGTLAAMTGGRTAGLEDSEWGAASGAYVKGSFGLNFGLTDKGSKNMEATELTQVYQALADISDALAEFFGEDLSSFIEAELQKMSDFGDGLIHLTEEEGDLGGAMAALVERIALAAGRSAEDIGIAFGALVGDLSGTAEEVGEQIQAAMLASSMAVELSDRFDEPLGQMLELTGDITADVKLLKGYVNEFGDSGETSAATINRLVTQLGLLDTAAKQTATDLEGLTAKALIELSDEIVAAFGSLDAASQAMAFYYQEFTTATQKLVDTITAAAKKINSEVPKLKDELMKLSEDVTKTITKVVEETGDSGKKLGDSLKNLINVPITDAGNQLASEAARWARSMENWIKLKGETPLLYIQINEGLEKFGDAMKDLGYEVDRGAQGFLNSIKKLQQAPKPAPGGDSVTETITIPGDPNAGTLAKLLDDLPKTREGFNELIGGLKLTDEASRKLYAGLMELLPQFDLLYDGVEAFEDWLLGTDAVERATRDLQKVFADWGMSLPTTREALQALYESGMFSTEQLAILAAHMEQLGLVFGNLGTEVDTIKAKIVDYTNLEIRLAEARGDDALALQLRRQQELDAAADEHSRSLLLQIYAYEDAAAAAARAREEHRRQWEAAEAARRAAYDAEAEAIRTYNAAAQAAADEANRAAREALQALQQAAEKAYQNASAIATAWIQAISALGLVAEATALQRRLESAALDPALRATYSQVWGIQDRAALAGGQADLAIQALGLLGRSTDAVAAERALALAGTDPALRGLQEWVFSLEDAKLAAEEAAAGIEDLIGSLEQVSAAIGGALKQVDALLVAPMAMQAMRRAEASAQLAALLSAARAGAMPTAASLERPLATLSEDPIAQYGDRVAYLRDLGRTRGQLAELQALVDAQIPIEQQNLEALKNLPVALYPNFEEIVSAIGTSSDDTAALLIQANAAIDAAIAAMAARDAAMEQAVKDIVPEIREIPPYVEEVYRELDLVGVDIVNGNEKVYRELDLVGVDIVNGNNAIIDALDQNRDGIISEMERQYPTLSALANDIALKMATTQLQVAGQVSYAEFQTMFAGLASDNEMKAWFDRLDVDQDGILSKHEIQIAKLTTGNSNETQMLSYLLNVIGKLETENVNSAMQITKLNDTIAKLQAQITELTTIKTNTTTLKDNDATKITYESKLPTIYDRLLLMWDQNQTGLGYWGKLPYMSDRLWNVEQYTYDTKLYSNVTKDKMGLVEQYTYGTKSNTSDTAKNTANLLRSDAIKYPTYFWPSYASGGISTGPTSGYPVTLHGREAVIPLGDGNSVNAILQDPGPPPPPNYLMHEAADTQELRRALEELHQELAALRRDTQTIGAATAGELKEHNRRERRRDVNGTLVEVMA